MKIYVVQEIGYEYNDEVYQESESRGGSPVKAYRSREKAEAARKELNDKAVVEDRYETYDGPVEDYYQVLEVEADEDEVEDYEGGKAKIKALDDELTRVAREAWASRTKALFEKFPSLESFGWRQFTPSFNDGDPCVFRVCAEEPFINGEHSCDVECDDEVVDAVAGLVYDFRYKDLERMFGGYSQVTANRDGTTTVEEYYR